MENEFVELISDWKTCNLSDFCRLPIKRTGSIAEIVVAYYMGNMDKPVRLLGFHTSSNKSDFDISEEAYLYFLGLTNEISNIKE